MNALPDSASAETLVLFKRPPAPVVDFSLTPDLQPIFEEAADIASFYAATVYISGPTGSGKNTLARHIHAHEQSARRNHKFVTVNLANVNKELIESQLFGHRRGSFSGAVNDYDGAFKEADKGTIFLDEIAELPGELQAKLLRVLDEKTFRPIGGKDDIQVDVRIIVATSRNLEQAVLDGNFREDLYHRINMLRLSVPSLRERPNDIQRLAEHFAVSVARENLKEPKPISPDAMDLLLRHSWPGNVRELAGILTTALNKARRDATILPHHLEFNTRLAQSAHIVDVHRATTIVPAPIAVSDAPSAAPAIDLSSPSPFTNFAELDDIYNDVRRRLIATALKKAAYIPKHAIKDIGYESVGAISSAFKILFRAPDFRKETFADILTNWQPAPQTQHSNFMDELISIGNIPAIESRIEAEKCKLTLQTLRANYFIVERAAVALGASHGAINNMITRHKLESWFATEQETFVREKFAAHNGNPVTMAQELGTDFRNVSSWLRKYGLVTASSPQSLSNGPT